MIAKIEHHLGELFPRAGFIVTTLTGTNGAVVRFYNQHGTAEQWIKEGKAATHWTRLSCQKAARLRWLFAGRPRSSIPKARRRMKTVPWGFWGSKITRSRSRTE